MLRMVNSRSIPRHPYMDDMCLKNYRTLTDGMLPIPAWLRQYVEEVPTMTHHILRMPPHLAPN